MDGPYRVVYVKAGGLSIAPAEPRMPEVIDLIQTALVPYVGMRVRNAEDHYLVVGIEHRLDLDCILALLIDNKNNPSSGLGRYFTDGNNIQF